MIWFTSASSTSSTFPGDETGAALRAFHTCNAGLIFFFRWGFWWAEMDWSQWITMNIHESSIFIDFHFLFWCQLRSNPFSQSDAHFFKDRNPFSSRLWKLSNGSRCLVQKAGCLGPFFTDVYGEAPCVTPRGSVKKNVGSSPFKWKGGR